MGYLKSFLIAASILFVGYQTYIFIKGRNDMFPYVKQIWKQFKWTIFLKCMLLILCTLGLVFLLNDIPYLNRGWYGYIFGSNKNITLAVIDVESENPFKVLAAIPFLFALLFLIPSFSQAEEIVFRKDRLSFKKRLIASIQFGLIHCLVGISPAAGIALILPGFYFSMIYKKNHSLSIAKGESDTKAHQYALEQSTVYHSLYNTILISTLIILILILATLLSMLSKNQ